MTKELFEELDLTIAELRKENQELKKQLENKYEKIGTLTSELLYEENTKLINQQKEFVNYLEDEINKWNYNYEYEVEEPTAEELANKILQKYKSIIGDDK